MSLFYNASEEQLALCLIIGWNTFLAMRRLCWCSFAGSERCSTHIKSAHPRFPPAFSTSSTSTVFLVGMVCSDRLALEVRGSWSWPTFFKAALSSSSFEDSPMKVAPPDSLLLFSELKDGDSGGEFPSLEIFLWDLDTSFSPSVLYM